MTNGTALYIALEGPDGVGKSTVATALREQLLRRNPTSTVRIRHFPTETLVRCAQLENNALTAADYAMDMENWLSFRPEPDMGTLYILDRWALSTAVYASIRGEEISENIALTLNWLNRVPLTTFVLMPKAPTELTDPDYPDPDGYDPSRVTKAYRTFLTNAFVAGELRRFIPIVVDRATDMPESTANEIAEWTAGLRKMQTEPEGM